MLKFRNKNQKFFLSKIFFALNILCFSVTLTAYATNETPILAKTIINAKKQALSADNFETAQEKIKKIAGSATLVESKDLQNKFTVTVKDMLDYVPGVIAQERSGQESRLSIRGSGLSRTFHLRGLNLYQDGVPINLADGASDFQDIDPLALDHIEIFKGANALHLGSATLGGAINYVSPTGYNSSPLSARIEGGSFGSVRGNLSSGKVIDKFDYFASLTEFKSDGYRQQNQQFDTKFFSNFGYRFNQNVENRTYLTIVNSNLELPGALTRAQMNSNPKQANAGNLKLKQERNFNLLRIANKTSWLYENYNANAGFYGNFKDLDHPIFEVLDQKTENYGAFADSTIKNNIFNYENEFLLGGNLSFGSTNAQQFINNNGSAGSLTVKGKEQSENVVFYAQNTLHATKKLSIILGSQFIYSKRNYSDHFLSNGDQSGVRKYFGTSPKISTIYNYDKNLQFYSNLSGAYEPPTFTEVRQTSGAGLANISAQKSYSLEVGTRRTKSAFNWDLSLYRSHLKDELILYSITPNRTQALNADKTLHQGVELGFDTKILSNIFAKKFNDAGDKIILRATYTLNDFRFVNDKIYGNKSIPGAPKHYVRGELRYENPFGFYLNPNVEISPQGIFIDANNSVKSANYWVLGLNTGFDFNKKFSIYLDGRNLLNKNYSPTTNVLSNRTNADPAVYYPANGRSFFAGLKYKF
jgi:iron complex outermembrane receptor protein